VTSRPDEAVRRRGVLLVAGAAVCWSSGGLIARLVTTSPWTTNLWRSVFASLFLALVLRVVRGRGIVAQWRDGGRPVVAVAVCMALASTCFILSLARTSVANTLILMSTGPYVAALLGWLLLGERVAPRTWLTMGVALTGAVVMVSSSYRRGAMAGDLVAIVMASSFAVATVLVRRHPEIQMAPAAVLATMLTALVALPLADPLQTAPRDLVLLAVFGVGQFGAGFLLFTAGARLIPAAQSSLIGMLETVLGPLWVWLVLNERPGTASLAGGALILAALLANTLVDLVTPRRPKAAGRSTMASRYTADNRRVKAGSPGGDDEHT
jgi:drug/metabolite transporter (DMT)-like permease